MIWHNDPRELIWHSRSPFIRSLHIIKNKTYFQWLGKMSGDSARRNQSLYCTYHREKGHTTKQCRVLKDHLEQLVKAGHLKEFLVDQGGGNAGQGSGSLNDHALPPLLEIIQVIPAALRGISWSSRRVVLSVVSSPKVDNEDQPKKKLKRVIASITFSEIDLEGTS